MNQVTRCAVSPLNSVKRFCKVIRVSIWRHLEQPIFGYCLLTEGSPIQRLFAIRFSLMIWDGRNGYQLDKATLSALLNSIGQPKLSISKSADHIVNSCQCQDRVASLGVWSRQAHLPNMPHSLILMISIVLQRQLRHIELSEGEPALDLQFQEMRKNMKVITWRKMSFWGETYLIKSADLRQTRAGKNYLAFTFDGGEGKLWM